MNRRQQVFDKLKPRVKALGFNSKELKSIATEIADNLLSESDASDEDVNAEIENRIDAVIPMLKVAQSRANREVSEWQKKHPVNIEDDDEGIEDDDEDKEEERPNVRTKSKSKRKSPKSKEKDEEGEEEPEETKTKDEEKKDEMPEWAKALMQKQEEAAKASNEQIAALKSQLDAFNAEKQTDTRKGKLDALLKDTGTFGTRTMKNFAKMKFDTDEEFEEFYKEVESDLKEFNQERADAGLKQMGGFPGGSSDNKNEEVVTDAEIDAIVNSL